MVYDKYVPDQKLMPILEAIRPENMAPALAPFFPEGPEALRLSSTHCEPPEYFWAVFRQGERRVAFKCLFYEDEYKEYVGRMERTYPDRVDRPDHPRGGMT